MQKTFKAKYVQIYFLPKTKRNVFFLFLIYKALFYLQEYCFLTTTYEFTDIAIHKNSFKIHFIFISTEKSVVSSRPVEDFSKSHLSGPNPDLGNLTI